MKKAAAAKMAAAVFDFSISKISSQTSAAAFSHCHGITAQN
jgi:hypothetical protein